MIHIFCIVGHFSALYNTCFTNLQLLYKLCLFSFELWKSSIRNKNCSFVVISTYKTKKLGLIFHLQSAGSKKEDKKKRGKKGQKPPPPQKSERPVSAKQQLQQQKGKGQGKSVEILLKPTAEIIIDGKDKCLGLYM